MIREMVHLILPQKLIKEPVIYMISKKFNIIPNIWRANITDETGEAVLE